ncbi:MAG TPA: hypothetical protein VEZ12_18125, partial [Herpetosiphonaceae bacterium]|nr:hypothetical protein [Herpetosiphonaceae bacterium]
LAPFLDRRLFLTKLNIYLTDPAKLADDFVFPFASRDYTSHQVDVKYVITDDPTPPAATSEGGETATAPGSGQVLVNLTLAVLAVVGAGFWLTHKRRRRRG